MPSHLAFDCPSVLNCCGPSAHLTSRATATWGIWPGPGAAIFNGNFEQKLRRLKISAPKSEIQSKKRSLDMAMSEICFHGVNENDQMKDSNSDFEYEIKNGRESKMSDASTSRKRSHSLASCKDSRSYDSESSEVDQIESLNEKTRPSENIQCQRLQRYYYTERERYLPLANITRSIKDAMNCAMPGRNIRVSKEG